MKIWNGKGISKINNKKRTVRVARFFWLFYGNRVRFVIKLLHMVSDILDVIYIHNGTKRGWL